MRSFEKTVGDMPIHVVGALPAADTPSRGTLLFVHMSWGGAWAFDRYVRFFSSYGYSCYALDLRGHGKSGGTVKGTTMNDYVSDVHTVARELSLPPPVVIGHSMGGLVALMYAATHPVAGVVSIDGSPPIEVQKTSEEKHYPSAYTPSDAGMPNPMKAMVVLSDMYPWQLMRMKMRLGVESGVARSERKKGISVRKDAIHSPMLFVGAEHGASLPFGIGAENVCAQAKYYGAPFREVKGASHPGILLGRHSKTSVNNILEWLQSVL